ncbi:hypothetical protein GCM10011519_35090 [Marmoricola endophyticus]|uniref:Uncharacterized protein n=1 Tax=Marmoricola endophyticus TaxID=2040280 RepID=A0A917BTJ8_9ACTN|nr:hypothetical protein [Marmoricola endophyticus]GGF58224.1 hypothetical protein GCM10011519_35090 [Marmoricola endophyticus]
MRVLVDDMQTPENRDRGTLSGADGRTYTRRSTRMSRRRADALIASGTPVVLDEGLLTWCDGDDAQAAWARERAYVIATAPTFEQRAKHYVWTAGSWESDDGSSIIFLVEHC